MRDHVDGVLRLEFELNGAVALLDDQTMPTKSQSVNRGRNYVTTTAYFAVCLSKALRFLVKSPPKHLS